MIKDEIYHDKNIKNTKQALAYDESADYCEWKSDIKQKFYELNGLNSIEENAAEKRNVCVFSTEEKDGYTLMRYAFESEKGTLVPCMLLLPSEKKDKYPVAICLQGHTTGYHISAGEYKTDGEQERFSTSDFALQAIKRGFAALCIEQRAMGSRRPSKPTRMQGVCCEHAALKSLMLGRTVAGERMFDVSRAIDTLSEFPACDVEKIMILGHSGGGTAAYYAACYDERIKYTVPVGAFCTYASSVLDVFHCSCNYIPFAYRYFEMHDLSCLIAPRPITVCTGVKDDIFPIGGVRKAYSVLCDVYGRAGASDKHDLVEMPVGHEWVPSVIWEAVMRRAEKAGLN